MCADPPADDGVLDAFSVLEALRPGARLTPSELAQLRAADTKFQTALFALRERARAEGRPWSAPTPAERAALRAVLEADVRAVLAERGDG